MKMLTWKKFNAEELVALKAQLFNKRGRPMQRAFVQQMKEEVLALVKDGTVPRTVKSFGDLHDHVDANELGGFCNEQLAALLDAAFRKATEPADDMPIELQLFFNRCQGAVHIWITKGGVTKEAQS